MQRKQTRDEAWDPVGAAKRKGGYGSDGRRSWVGLG